MKLTGKQVQQLEKSLLSAYPTKSKLKRMVRIELDKNLASIAGGNNLSDIIFELISWAESEGLLDELITKAHQHNLGNPDLNAFVQQLKLSSPSSDALDGQRQRLEQKQTELQKQWDDLSNRIEANLKDQSQTMDGERKLVLENRLQDLRNKRDAVERELEGIEAKLK